MPIITNRNETIMSAWKAMLNSFLISRPCLREAAVMRSKGFFTILEAAISPRKPRFFATALIGLLFAGSLIISAGYCDPSPSSEKKVLRVGGNADFMPFEFTNSQGRPDGYTIDLIRALAEQLGLQVDISLGTWHEQRQLLESGGIDVLPGVLYSPQRDQVFDFSVPHMVFSYSVFVREGTPYKSIMDLKNKAVAVVAGVYAHDWLRSNEFTKNITAVDTPQTALELVSKGEQDFAVLPKLHGLDMLRRLKIANVKTVGPPVLTQKFCLAVTAGNADLLAELNEGLVQLQKNGVYDRIYLKWFSINEQRQRLLSYALWIFLIILTAVVIVLLWNLTLKRKVNLKTRELTQKETLLRQILQGLPGPTFVIDHNHKVLYWNRTCESLTGASGAQVLGTSKHKTFFYNPDQTVLSDMLLACENDGSQNGSYPSGCRPCSLIEGGCESEMFFSHLGDEGKWLFGTAALIRDEDGRLIGAIESWQDLTEHKRLEAQLIQSQKMEAIGTLAGGIAHDFSNILTAISAHTEMARRKESKKTDITETLSSIMTACNHGKDLIHRLKMFHRPSESTIRPKRIDSIINEAIDLARFTLPSSIQIHRRIQSQAQAAVDATQLLQVVMNLCTNAAQAMKGQSGELTISLTDATADENITLASNREYDDAYIKLTVSDTGHGIPTDILQRIFEPFFTTKPQNQGSGMGLSVSHGIIKNFGGHITVESRPGEGTDFLVFLPVHRSSSANNH